METSEYFSAHILSRDCDGQSTVEFALTMTLFLGFTFFLLQTSLAFSFGNYAHYATFMAARSYLSSGPDSSDQQQRAQFVIGYMLKRSAYQPRSDKFPSIAKGSGGASADFPGLDLGPGRLYQASDDNSLWMVGARYTFTSRLFPLPIGRKRGSASASPPSSITLTSESWLGREPSEVECTAAMGTLKGIFDNGC